MRTPLTVLATMATTWVSIALSYASVNGADILPAIAASGVAGLVVMCGAQWMRLPVAWPVTHSALLALCTTSSGLAGTQGGATTTWTSTAAFLLGLAAMVTASVISYVFSAGQQPRNAPQG